MSKNSEYFAVYSEDKIRSLSPRRGRRCYHGQHIEQSEKELQVNMTACICEKAGTRKGEYTMDLKGAEEEKDLQAPQENESWQKATLVGVPNGGKEYFRGKVEYAYLDHPADVVLFAGGIDIATAFRSAGLALFNYMTDIRRVELKLRRFIVAFGRDLPDLLFHFLDEMLFLYGSEYFICGDLYCTELYPPLANNETLINDKYTDSLARQTNVDILSELTSSNIEEAIAMKSQRYLCNDSQCNPSLASTNAAFYTKSSLLEDLGTTIHPQSQWCIKALCYGEIFNRYKHSQGTEVKAITMHEMRVNIFYKGHMSRHDELPLNFFNQNPHVLQNTRYSSVDTPASRVELYVLVDI